MVASRPVRSERAPTLASRPRARARGRAGGGPQAGHAQDAPRRRSSRRPSRSPPVFSGSFEGWATLSNDDPTIACRYEGIPGTPSVHLEFGAGKTIAGSIAIDMPAPAGTRVSGPAQALRDRRGVARRVPRSRSRTRAATSGRSQLRENGKALQGLLTWRQGGAEEPLAEGFSLPGGKRPMARLSGEVQLRRVVPGATGAAAATPASVGAGKQAGHIVAIVGANIVGLGLLYGANKLGKGSSSSGSVTCSPRVCVVGTPGAPCFCESNVLSGAPCGTTQAGAPIGAPCDGQSVPCQAALSCNSGVCEDRDGRCPY